MENLNKKYRCFHLFGDDGMAIKTELNSKGVLCYDPDDTMMYCYKGKIHVIKQDDDTLRAVIFGGTIFNTIIKNMIAHKIEIKDSYLLDGEGYIDFNYKDMNKMSTIVKAKKNRAKPVGLLDKSNYTDFLRIMKNVSDKYSVKLDEVIKSQRKKKKVVK